MKTLVIDRASMGMGGIESNYANVIKYAGLPRRLADDEGPRGSLRLQGDYG